MRSGLGLDVAPTRYTPPPRPTSTPSISVRKALTTRSVTPVESGNEAVNLVKEEDDAALARAKTTQTAASLAPMYLERSWGPLMWMNRRPCCSRDGMAKARRVYPVPG